MSAKVELLIENCSQALFTGSRDEGRDLSTGVSVAVSDGRIVGVGTHEEIEGRYRAEHRIDGSGRLLTPAFVDSHTHLVFAGDRSHEFARRCSGASYEEIASAGGGIRASVRATRAASEEELFDLALARAVRMLSLGTTTIEIKSGYGLDLETELRMLRVIRRLGQELPIRIVPTFMGAHEFPDEYRDDREGYVDEVCETMIPAVAAEGLAVFCDVFCEESVFTPEQSLRVLECGRRAGLVPKIHADELANSGGSRVASQVSAASADHLMKVVDSDIRALVSADVVTTLLPGTTFFLGKEQYAPARAFLDAGATVALATDRNPGSCTIESMQFIIGLSCLRMGMTPIEAFRGATENGARALGLENVCGRIAPGLAADLILWDCPDPDRIVYEFENIIPRTVFVGGRPVFGMHLDRRK
ncbi:MAG: imidazolonepropionase [Planctomycetes bacterium]|nr:imidazolonepropionase [Planctomycetota bacterium]